MLFLLYINDINDAITSQINKIKLFADDSVQYIDIHSQNDSLILQNDLHTIASLAEKNE